MNLVFEVNILEENCFSLNYLLQILAKNCFTDNHITQSTRGLHSSATETCAQLGLCSFMRTTYFMTKSPFKHIKGRENSHGIEVVLNTIRLKIAVGYGKAIKWQFIVSVMALTKSSALNVSFWPISQ